MRAALQALRQGDLRTAAAALHALGGTGRWAQHALSRAAMLHGHARGVALHALERELASSLVPARPAPVHREHLEALIAESQALYLGIAQRILRFLSQLFAGPLASGLNWLDEGRHLVYVLGVLSAGLLVIVYLWLGRFVPRGASQALYGSDSAARGPFGQWREAEDLWRQGERLLALGLGRSAVIARLDRSGLLRAMPGLSDREIERSLAKHESGGAAKAFRRAYAYGRWADGRDELALQEAWQQLRLLWQTGENR